MFELGSRLAETQNLYKRFPERFTLFEEEAKARLLESRAEALGIELDEEMLKRMRNMGYLGDGSNSAADSEELCR